MKLKTQTEFNVKRTFEVTKGFLDKGFCRIRDEGSCFKTKMKIISW
jgi:hypothetical protein